MLDENRDRGEFDLEAAPGMEPESGGLVEEGAPLWTTTFGDMMSLLLTFFILLFSMSELKMERFLLAAQSMREAMGGTAEAVMEDPMGLMPDPVDPELNLQNPGRNPGATESPVESLGDQESWVETFTAAYLEMIARKLREMVEEQGLQDEVTVTEEGDGVYLRIETVALFGSGEAVLQDRGREILGYLSRITTSLDVGVVVSGHADNQVIRSAQFPSNWELSAARAAGVARELVAAGQDPLLTRVESFGEFRPLASNDTPEGRARNRRVELFYSREDVRKAALRWAAGEEGGAPAP